MRRNITILGIKDPVEIIPITMDFDAVVTTIDSMAWSISVISGTDPDSATMLVGTPDIIGATATHLIADGLDGCIYLIRCDIVSGSTEYTLGAYLVVKTLGQ